MKRLIPFVILLVLGLSGTWAQAQNTECAGLGTVAADGMPFIDGYNYSFTTNGTDVTINFELIEPRDGLVAYAQTYNPDFAEVPMDNVGGQSFAYTFPGQTMDATFSVACKFAFAGGLSTTEVLAYTVGNDCGGGGSDVLGLPIDFESMDIDYELTDFGGNASSIVVDPTDAGNMVVQSTKAGDAQLWAGTTVGDVTGFAMPIPFAPGATSMTVRVWSPTSGTPIRLKVEQVGVPEVSVETEAMTTMESGWETLTFDFSNQVDGTAEINFGSTYNKASMFFNFGTDGATAGEQTYYWDDVTFVPGSGGGDGIELPIDFESMEVDYELQDFGGNNSMIVVDPTDAGNMVVQSTKAGDAQLWAGTTVGDVTGFAMPIPFEPGATSMTVRVWSPTSGTPIRLKVEQVGVPEVSVETEAMTTMESTWETLTFDFSNQVDGTAEINFGSTYNKASMFFNFGTDGATAGEQTYYWDDVTFVPGSGGGDGIELPIDFESMEVDYELQDFGGNNSMIVVDPTDAGNMVVQSTKAGDAQLWAGTTVGDVTGFAMPIPFEPGATSMTVRVWSPTSGTPIRLKVEQVGVPEVSVETEAMTTMESAWETLTFDFSNQVDGTAEINFGSTYNKASMFFNFGTDGATAGEQTYYWDDVVFVPGMGGDGIELPIDFESMDIDYELQDFGGNVSMIVVDPTDAGNMVVQSTKAGDAQLWAGTTVGDATGFSMPLPFAPGATTMTVRVWSPTSGTPIRLKVEQVGVPEVSVETEAMTTMESAWETLTFDFSNQVDGTAEINFGSTYNKASMFFNFGTDGATAGEQTYYWDDVTFVPGSGGGSIELPIDFESMDIDYELTDFGGNASQIVVDPTDAGNMVVESIKTGGAQTWAGTTVGDVTGFSMPIPFAPGATTMTVRVWSPTSGTPIRMKVEQVGVPEVSVETEVMTTMESTWETLTFDFSNQVDGTAELNFGSTYNKASMFFNFGTDGATAGEQTYYWDDVVFVPGMGGDGLELPIDFESMDIDYEITDFGGNASQIVVDPTDAGNMVVESIKTGGAQTWAGTTVGEITGFAEPIPFEEGATTMSVRVWSPTAGTPIRMKVEQLGVPEVSVETEAMTTMEGMWETLVFDFANQADGTAEINFSSTYTKASMFFNFGTDGATAGEQTYYWDDVTFGAPEPYTVVNVILDSPNHTTLAFALQEAELIDALNGAGPFTVFAPTNDAFDALPDGVLDDLLDDPTGDLQEILLYHVLGQQLMAGDIVDGPQTSLQGEDLDLAVDGSDVTVNDANVNPADMMADNGVVHSIDAVLLFPSFGVGLEEINSQDNISVYPNPSSDIVNVEMTESDITESIISIYDLTGKVVLQYNVESRITSLNTSLLNAGHYVLRLDTPKGSFYQKIVLMK